MATTSTALKKLRKDLKILESDPPPGVSACPVDDDIFTWNAVVAGPDDTPFEGGVFNLKLKFTDIYPHKAPTVWFYSKMFHPNVYKDGKICLDILEQEDKWDSNYDVAAVLCAIQAMLGDPNPNSPANGEANGLFLRDTEKYEKLVKEIVDLSARRRELDEEEDEMWNENELTENEQTNADEDRNLQLLLSLSLEDHNFNESVAGPKQ